MSELDFNKVTESTITHGSQAAHDALSPESQELADFNHEFEDPMSSISFLDDETEQALWFKCCLKSRAALLYKALGLQSCSSA